MQPAVWRLNTFKFQPVHYAASELFFFPNQINATISVWIEEFSLPIQQLNRFQFLINTMQRNSKRFFMCPNFK